MDFAIAQTGHFEFCRPRLPSTRTVAFYGSRLVVIQSIKMKAALTCAWTDTAGDEARLHFCHAMAEIEVSPGPYPAINQPPAG